MKKSWLLGFILLVSMSFASSQGISDLLSQIDESTVVFMALFLIAFSLLFFSLNKIFKRQNTAISGIISASLAFLLVFWVNKSGFDVEYSLNNIGISSNVLSTLLPILIVAGIIFLIVQFRKDSLYIIGGLLIALSFFVYAKTLLIAVGVILILIRLFLGRKGRGFWEQRGKGIGPRGWGRLMTGRPISHEKASQEYYDAGAGI